MKHKPVRRIWIILLVLTLTLPQLIRADMTDPGGNITLSGGDFGPVGGHAETNQVSLFSGSYPPSRLTRQDYYNAYQDALELLKIGKHFRSQELQRLDPATCVAQPDNPDACAFSVTGIQNNYLDFGNGKLYWRFCADYDEPYVGIANIPHDVDDPNDELNFDPYGFCPAWDALQSDQQTRRVGNETLVEEEEEKDIRNKLVDARRIFFFLAVAEPSMVFDGNLLVDDWTVNPDGTISRIPGGDGNPDRVRDIGVGGMLEATREMASAHMIFGNEFMVDALRFPFSTDATDTEQIVRDEQRQLERALWQYQLAVDALLYVLNYNLGGFADTYVTDYFSPREYQLFNAASERMVTALTEIAKRERLLGADPAAGDQAALQRLNSGFLDQYIQGLALASQAAHYVQDDPATLEVNESKLTFLDNGGRDIMNNLRRLGQQAENIRAGLNPLGYEETFVPLQAFPDLLELTCGGRTACTENAGLLNSAYIAGQDLRDSQRTFDEKFDELKAALTDLQNDFDEILTEICGSIGAVDNDGDGLKDWVPCGLEDKNGSGYYEPGETEGLMGQSFWDMVAAQNRVSLATRQAEAIAEQIRIEEERAGRVINVTLGTAEKISAYKLAIGKLNAYKSTRNVAVSGSTTAYLDTSLSTTSSAETGVKADANPVGCILGKCSAYTELSFEVAFKTEAGLRVETSLVSTADMTWDPNEAIVGQYESATALREAERDAQIEGANSAAVIKQLLLEQSQALIEMEIAQAEMNKVIDEHNLLVERYHLYLTQRAGTVTALQESYLSKPYFRLFRDAAALEAARTLDQATQAAYLTAKALEYYALSPVSYMRELYRVRNPSNLRAVLDKLASDYAAIQPEQFSKVTYRLSVAEDILGLTDENLNPDGSLTPAEVDQLRFARFQAFLHQNRYTVPDLDQNKIAFAFGTTIDHPKFLHGVFNNRISRNSTTDPGCTAGDGCRGVWLNLITDQDPADFQGSWPKIKLVHGGHAVYRNGSLQEVSYTPGPAVMIGRSLPPGFGGDDRADLMTSHVNLSPVAAPDTNFLSSRFYNLSIATSQWIIDIDLTNPLENTILDVNQIKDIEIRMDTTFVTPSRNQQLVAMDIQRVEAETTRQPVPEEVRTFLTAYEQRQAARRATTQAELEATPPAQISATEDRYVGTLFVSEPIHMGIFDIGFDLSFDDSGQVSGALCSDCSAIYPIDQSISLAGTWYSQTFSFTTDTFSRTLGGRQADRTITCQGDIKENGQLLEGTCADTITGLTPHPIVAQGDFLVSGHARSGYATGLQLHLYASPAAVPLSGSATISATIKDTLGGTVILTPTETVTFTASLGTVSPSVVETVDGQAVTTFTAGDLPGTAVITATTTTLTETIQVQVLSPGSNFIYLPLVLRN